MDKYETAVYHIRGWWSVGNAFWDGLWMWVHNGVIVRRGALVFSGYMTYKIVMWMGAFIDRAQAAGMNGMEIAAIIAAIGTPMGLLQGAIFKFYGEGRNKLIAKNGAKHDGTTA